LASRLRQDLERQFGPEWGPWVDKMGELRRGILRSAMEPKERRKRLLEMARRKPSTSLRRHSSKRRGKSTPPR
jgi:siroheme synthase (precorrin-2 oxidase/ferrochelatase)